MKKDMSTFLQNIDEQKVNDLLKETHENSQYFTSMCKDIVSKYISPLDELQKEIYEVMIVNKDTSIPTMENYYLELTNMIYFLYDKLEEVGVFADMSKASAKEVYSKAYLSSQEVDDNGKKKTTVAECSSRAELSSQYETIVGNIYDHAYKVIKSKVDSAIEMMNAIRKILTVRSSELQLSRVSANSYTENRYGGE